MLNKIRRFVPEGMTIVSQGEYVASSLKDYLHRHPEMDRKCTRNGTCLYLTTESENKFGESASIFLNERIMAQRISMG